jgi:hypothetical protein
MKRADFLCTKFALLQDKEEMPKSDLFGNQTLPFKT